MKHVFVETNWVFEFCAPAHRSTPEAQSLATRAGTHELVLHVPSVSLREGANAIQQKCQPKAKELQEFRRWAEANGRLDVTTAGEAKTFLDAYVNSVNADMATLENRVGAISGLVGVDVFALDERMLDRAIGLRREVPTLKPFDEAILAAILVKAGDVRPGATSLVFCDLDGDLVPMDRKGNPRKELVALYAAAGIVVRQDFQVPSTRRLSQGWSQGWNACRAGILSADFDLLGWGNSANPLLTRFSAEIDTVGVAGSIPVVPTRKG